MSCESEYSTLVAKRMECRACVGLVNPSSCRGGIFDSSEIGPWSRWQGNLRSPLLVVGQDWSDEAGFVSTRGVDEDSNPTNINLIKLLGSIGVAVPPPSTCVDAEERGSVFFTNAVLCLKAGGLQANVKGDWTRTCSDRFLRTLIALIRPSVIVALGAEAFTAVHYAFGIREPNWNKFSNVVEVERGFAMPGGGTLFPQYHCGARGVNINRSIDKQLADWGKVGKALASVRS